MFGPGSAYFAASGHRSPVLVFDGCERLDRPVARAASGRGPGAERRRGRVLVTIAWIRGCGRRRATGRRARSSSGASVSKLTHQTLAVPRERMSGAGSYRSSGRCSRHVGSCRAWAPHCGGDRTMSSSRRPIWMRPQRGLGLSTGSALPGAGGARALGTHNRIVPLGGCYVEILARGRTARRQRGLSSGGRWPPASCRSAGD